MSSQDAADNHPMKYKPRDEEFMPLTEEQKTFELWNRLHMPYSRYFLPALKPIYSAVASKAASLMQDTELPKILDIGSSVGEPSLSIAKMLQDSTVLSTDISARSVVMGRARAEQNNVKNIEFFGCNADNLMFDAESFDLVSSSFLLPYVDVSKVADETFRVLKLGGKLLLVDFASEEADVLRPLLAVLDAFVPDRKQLPPQQGCYPDRWATQVEQLKAELERAGFQDITYEKVDIELDIVVSVEEAWEMYREYIEQLLEHQKADVSTAAREVFIKHLEDRKLIRDGQVYLWQESRILLIEASKPMKSWFQQLFE